MKTFYVAPVERTAAAYRQARVDVLMWTTTELRHRQRVLEGQATKCLDDIGYSHLRAVADELQARPPAT